MAEVHQAARHKRPCRCQAVVRRQSLHRRNSDHRASRSALATAASQSGPATARSAAKSTALRTDTSGARSADGRRPAKRSPTKYGFQCRCGVVESTCQRSERVSVQFFYHDYRHFLDVVGVKQVPKSQFNERFPESDKIQLHQNNIMTPFVYKAQRVCQKCFEVVSQEFNKKGKILPHKV